MRINLWIHQLSQESSATPLPETELQPSKIAKTQAKDQLNKDTKRLAAPPYSQSSKQKLTENSMFKARAVMLRPVKKIQEDSHYQSKYTHLTRMLETKSPQMPIKLQELPNLTNSS